MRTLNSAEIHPDSCPTTAVFANWLGPGSPKDPFTYLHTFLLGHGNSCFHCWIQILGCRHKSSFQNCCGRLRAPGKLWDQHIHPRLTSGNENPDQGRWGTEDRRLQAGDPFYMFLTGNTVLLLPNTHVPPSSSPPGQWDAPKESECWPTVYKQKGGKQFQNIMIIDYRGVHGLSLLPVPTPWGMGSATPLCKTQSCFPISGSSWPSDLHWPIECSGSDVVLVPNLHL